MSYSISGNLSEQARVIILNQSTGAIENINSFSQGAWELSTNDDNYKIVIARKHDSGEAYGYSSVIPTGHVATSPALAIDSSNNLLAINDEGDVLLI